MASSRRWWIGGAVGIAAAAVWAWRAAQPDDGPPADVWNTVDRRAVVLDGPGGHALADFQYVRLWRSGGPGYVYGWVRQPSTLETWLARHGFSGRAKTQWIWIQCSESPRATQAPDDPWVPLHAHPFPGLLQDPSALDRTFRTPCPICAARRSAVAGR